MQQLAFTFKNDLPCQAAQRSFTADAGKHVAYLKFEQLSKENKLVSLKASIELSKQFKQRQDKFAKSFHLTRAEIMEANIADKVRFRQPLTDAEMLYFNENYYIPQGYKMGRFSLVKVKR